MPRSRIAVVSVPVPAPSSTTHAPDSMSPAMSFASQRLLGATEATRKRSRSQPRTNTRLCG